MRPRHLPSLNDWQTRLAGVESNSKPVNRRKSNEFWEQRNRHGPHLVLHTPLQGFDSIVGEISKQDGLTIKYEIGAIPKPGALLLLGGMFSDRPKSTPKDQVRFYLEQTVNGQPVHLAYRKDNTLMASYPKKGINLWVTVASADEMAEALLMILTYPNAPVGDQE